MTMKLSRSVMVAAGISVGVALSATATARDFNASIWFPDAHPLTSFGYLDWASELEEATNGELRANVYTGDVLLPPAGHLTGIRDGVADVGYHAGTYTPAELPVDNVLAQLGFGRSDYFVSAFAITDMNMTDSEALAQWDRHNIVYGGGYATPPYRLICTSEIRTLDDIEGKAIRTPSAVHATWAKSVGAVPVSVPSSEMFTGLDKGQVDCVAQAANDLKSRSLWDVADHVTLIDFGVYWAGYQYGINKDFWQSLEDEQRRAMLDTIAEAMVRTGIGYLAQAEEALDEASEHGVTVHEPSADLTESLEDFRTKVRDDAIAMGDEEFDLPDSEALVSRFEERIEKWEGLLEDVDRNDEEALIELVKSELFDEIDVSEYGMD